jgi:hypothetical protein
MNAEERVIMVDIHYASKNYKGYPDGLQNLPNCGFMHIRSIQWSIDFFKFWYHSSLTYPGEKTSNGS